MKTGFLNSQKNITLMQTVTCKCLLMEAGAADRSYGIYVAKLAGIPKSVIKRADNILQDLEDINGNNYVKNKKKSNSESHTDNSPSLFDWQSD
ncbi:hypothetical protein PQO01_03840 [Lentisphaera marina]|uniref:MutS-related protein n=1 Tax=Lentisphaera marina TaxID=1111041 RepID=UPI002366AFBE|nr:hypothetical protein [Lentisphaera marina]MDD7984082.1 hypothetical protein [Lentisphaera marina]